MGGDLSPLSEQQLVDCDTVDSGCNGGLMDNGFAFAEKNAMCTEDSYSYTARKGTCKASSCTVGLAQGSVTGYKDVSTDSEQALMSAVAQQPVSIAIEADQSSFQSYSSGVLTASCGTKLDHGVLAVGYGTDVGTDYWKVKNSWEAPGASRVTSDSIAARVVRANVVSSLDHHRIPSFPGLLLLLLLLLQAQHHLHHLRPLPRRTTTGTGTRLKASWSEFPAHWPKIRDCRRQCCVSFILCCSTGDETQIRKKKKKKNPLVKPPPKKKKKKKKKKK